MDKITGIFLFALGLVILVGVLYANSRFRSQTRSFSTYTLLTSSWEKYKDRFINKDGRVIDDSVGDITTSEGQSYAMLRAVWIDDKETFDKVWSWTKNTLKRKDSNLFAWRWGKREDGTYGFIGEGGANSASDADQDIALGLIFASRRWKDVSYLRDVSGILNDIWDKETALVDSRRYLVAGEWAKGDDEIIVNPSYFAPYAWRVFAEVDKSNDWNSLVGPAYDLLEEAGRSPLGATVSAGLPPDWLAVTKSGELKEPGVPQLTTNYSYDAMRIPWRIALDYQWYGDERAKRYLQTLEPLAKIYRESGRLVPSYSHAGQPLADYESPAMYATALGFFTVLKPPLAKEIYENKILKLYSNDTNSFRQELNYYDQNWFWFSAGLYYKKLVKL